MEGTEHQTGRNQFLCCRDKSNTALPWKNHIELEKFVWKYRKSNIEFCTVFATKVSAVLKGFQRKITFCRKFSVFCVRAKICRFGHQAGLDRNFSWNWDGSLGHNAAPTYNVRRSLRLNHSHVVERNLLAQFFKMSPTPQKIIPRSLGELVATKRPRKMCHLLTSVPQFDSVRSFWHRCDDTIFFPSSQRYFVFISHNNNANAQTKGLFWQVNHRLA